MKIRFLHILLLSVFLPVTTAFATIHTINSSGFSFSPPALNITVGDTVNFVLASIHDAVEVSKAVWDTNGNVPLSGGFAVGFGGGQVVLTDTGIHYYVCQPHASLGMKGTITVSPVVILPNTLTVLSAADQDGNPATSGDQGAKNWGLRIYRDSVGSGILVASVASGNQLTVDTLSAGTYVAVEDDSSSWSHRSITVDGSSLGATQANHYSISVTQGQSHTIEFLNYAPRIILSSGMTFVPESLAIHQGDTVRFVLDAAHNAVEVSQSTWLANDTLSNGGFAVPYGGGTVIFPSTGEYLYVCQAHAFMGMKGKITVTNPPVQTNRTVAVADGWNMVSVPLIVDDSSAASIFPGAGSLPFGYDGRYLPKTSLTPGAGYWLKSIGPMSFIINGVAFSRDSIDLVKGWNMIGSISTPVSVASVQSDPPGIISSHFFGFNGAYTIADTIQPGGGYWVKLSQTGRIILDSAAALFKQSTEARAADPAGVKLVVRDAGGRQQTLSILEGGGTPPQRRSLADLPPLPPPGTFDVRFASDRLSEFIDGSSGEQFALRISEAKFPVKLLWDVGELNRSVTLEIDGQIISLDNDGAVALTSPGKDLSVHVGGPVQTPLKYAIDRVYPNPFNPSTTIRYSLPVESRVIIRVFSVLGQQVAVLADQVQNPGMRSVEWNSSTGPVQVASGVYFIRMEGTPVAGSNVPFVQVVPIVLQK